MKICQYCGNESSFSHLRKCSEFNRTKTKTAKKIIEQKPFVVKQSESKLAEFDQDSATYYSLSDFKKAKSLLDKNHPLKFGEKAARVYEVKVGNKSVAFVKFCQSKEGTAYLELDRFYINPKFKTVEFMATVMTQIINMDEYTPKLLSIKLTPSQSFKSIVCKSSIWKASKTAKSRYFWIDWAGVPVSKSFITDKSKELGMTEHGLVEMYGFVRIDNFNGKSANRFIL